MKIDAKVVQVKSLWKSTRNRRESNVYENIRKTSKSQMADEKSMENQTSTNIERKYPRTSNVDENRRRIKEDRTSTKIECRRKTIKSRRKPNVDEHRRQINTNRMPTRNESQRKIDENRMPRNSNGTSRKIECRRKSISPKGLSTEINEISTEIDRRRKSKTHRGKNRTLTNDKAES